MFIAIRVDASLQFGAGHAIRCLTLADELRARGADVLFVSAAILDSVAQRIEQAGHRLILIAQSDAGVEETGRDWDKSCMPPEQQQVDATSFLEALGARLPDWVIADHYRLGEPWETSICPFVQRILVIDDLANRTHLCQILLDQNLGHDDTAYQMLVPPRCSLLVGTRYALLRPAFAKLREEALSRRRGLERPSRLLVAFGLTDLGGISSMFVDRALAAGVDCRMDVVVGSEAQSRLELAELTAERPNLHLHVDSREMEHLIASADLAVGAAGVSSLERCCLGLPTVVLALAENQRLVARNLDRAGAAFYVESLEEAVSAAANLIEDPATLRRMSEAASLLVDGRGAERVSAAMDLPRRRLAD